MKINNFKIILLILFAVPFAGAQGRNNYTPPEAENIRPNATQISGRVSNIIFSPSGESVVLQTDCGFFILPGARLDNAIADLEKSDPHEGEVKGFLPSGKIVYSTSRGLFTLDPATLESRPIFQMTETEAQTEEYFYNRATFVISENLIVAEDGSYEKDLAKGNILRYDIQKQKVARGAQIYAFNEGRMSPDGGYIFYRHYETPDRFGDLYDVKRDINYVISKRYKFTRHFPDLKIINIAPLTWVDANKFLVRIDAYQSSDYNLMPTWLVLLDAATGKIVWKQEQNSDNEVYLQLVNSTKALLERYGELYELSLANGNLAKIPDLAGTTFSISPDKKKLAFLKDNQIFISAANGTDKKLILDLPENWHGRLLYDGKKVRRIDWSPDGKRLFLLGDLELLAVRL